MPQTCHDAFGNLWFDTAAAAALLCPVSDLEKWPGIDSPLYDVACGEDTPWIFRLEQQPGEFYSLWRERTSIAWQPAPDATEGLLWRWVVGPHQLPIAPPPLPEGVVQIAKPIIPENPTTDYLLFDSIDEGRDARATSLPIHLARPLRQIETYAYQLNPETTVILHRLVT